MKCTDCLHNDICQIMRPGTSCCVPNYYNSTNTAEECKYFALNNQGIESCDGCRWRKEERYQRCNCCRRNKSLKDGYEKEATQ